MVLWKGREERGKEKEVERNDEMEQGEFRTILVK